MMPTLYFFIQWSLFVKERVAAMKNSLQRNKPRDQVEQLLIREGLFKAHGHQARRQGRATDDLVRRNILLLPGEIDEQQAGRGIVADCPGVTLPIARFHDMR